VDTGDTPDTPTRILDAAIEAAAIHGISRLSVGDVATRAGLSRPTLYKYFPNKDALVAAAVEREARQLVVAVLAAAEAHDSPKDSLEAGFLTALRLTREHPLLDRIIRTEPETLVPLLTTDGGPVLLLVRQTVERVITSRSPDLDPVMARRTADVITRLLVSYAISAPDDPPEVVAASVASFLVDGALGDASEAHR
jgi:AcrR family transcriptional regulator